ncbi:MAG: hypothetical protein K0R67_1127, partial [Paenibacillus sp.]|nr:hypothetical protein [Paenibacillus sp.]
MFIKKNLSIGLIITILVSLLPIMGHSQRALAAETYGTNLISNGGFEEWNAGVPVGWTKALAAAGALTQESLPENVQADASSARLSAHAETGDSAGLRYSGIPVQGGKSYQVSFHYKKPNSPSTAYVYFKLTYRKSDNTVISPTTVEKLPTAEMPNFTLFEKNFAAPNEAVSVTYEFLMQKGAEIIIDNASYKEVLPIH